MVCRFFHIYQIHQAGTYQFLRSMGIRSEAIQTTAPVPISVFKFPVPPRELSSSCSFSSGERTEKFFTALEGADAFLFPLIQQDCSIDLQLFQYSSKRQKRYFPLSNILLCYGTGGGLNLKTIAATERSSADMWHVFREPQAGKGSTSSKSIFSNAYNSLRNYDICQTAALGEGFLTYVCHALRNNYLL